MPTINEQIKLHAGTYAEYAGKTPVENDIYFCTDTQQLFVGSTEYTKSVKTLNAEPTAATTGNIGALYSYNGNLYLCAGKSGSDFTWTRVANINDNQGTVTSITATDGVETGDGSAITSSGTIKHSIPSGAAAHTDTFNDQTPGFGETFNIESVGTDKFGHVNAINTTTVTIPAETVISTTDTTGTAQTLAPEGTFSVITGVSKGTGSHEVSVETTTFTMPADNDTTYTFATGTTEGTFNVTSSATGATTQAVAINGWADLAKKSDISTVFQFKGTVATDSELPSTYGADQVGYVYFVTADNSEYVWVYDSDTSTGRWEKLGPVIDLSAYALSADVIQRVTGAEGYIPKFKSDGTLESSGYEPADFIYTHPTHTAYASGFYKVTVDAEGHVTAATAVTSSDISALGVEITDEKVKNTPSTTDNAIYLTGTTTATESTGTQKFNTGVYVNATDSSLTATEFIGDLTGTADVAEKLGTTDVGTATQPIFLDDGVATASDATVGAATQPVYLNNGVITAVGSSLAVDITGNAATATNATNDASGNNIATTYATKDEAKLVWNAI